MEANPAFEQQSGLTQAIGKTAREFTPNLEAVFLTHYETVLATGEPIEFEIQPADLGRYFRVAAYRYGDPQNKQLAIVFNDISDRKLNEQQQAFLLKLSDALRPLSDPSEIQRAAMHNLGEYLALDRAMYAEITPDGKTVIVNDNYLISNYIELADNKVQG